ncbi:hypothetical protein [Pedosphaera parvula]|uniref:TIR domain-containing protein n=1 Tax=Pedosphaera parvula (strain Ellin514) TaxID=320771 RepID=B9XB71_PEDPL|nr:hypothetical protein [Pedosphaera parvula]EEF62756.1 hypothetical protein Cflav_PD5391 [Pedosphaera parvula Ellin514]
MDDVARNIRGWELEGKLQHDCEIMVVYQDRATQQVASVLCDHLEHSLEPDLDLTFTWLSLAKLDVPHCMQGAIHAASSADLLIFSLSTDLPKSVEGLVQGSLQHRTKRNGAIIGLLGKHLPSAGIKPPVHQKFEALARQTGFQYWAPQSWNDLGEIPGSLDSFLRRAYEVTPLLEEILHR